MDNALLSEAAMRPSSFILALAFLIGGPLAGHAPRTGLPSAGVFTYNGTPLAIETTQFVTAAVTRVRR